MIFIALSNILKGFFWGSSKIAAPSIIDIFEKALRIATVAILIYIFQAKTLTTLVSLCYVALAIGELQSLLLLFFYYKKTIKKLERTYEKPERLSQLLFNVLVVSVPLTLNGFLSNIFNTLSTLVIPRCLISAGFEHSEALSLIGKFTGMAMMIIGMPLIVVSSINTLLIPDLSQTIIKGNLYDAKIRIKKVLKISFLLGLATTVICLLIPSSLGEMFYNRQDLGTYIKYAGLCAPVFFISVPMSSILNGLNKQGIILRNSVIVAFLELLFLYIFTPIKSINIYGYAITLFLTSLISFIINYYEIKKHIDISLSITNIIIYLLLTLLTLLILKLFIVNILGTLNPFKNILIIILSFLIFVYLGRFGNED